MPDFAVLHQKAIPVPNDASCDSEICISAACPSMDLVAFANSSQVVISRSIPTWETLFKESVDIKDDDRSGISCIEWRPDGKALAAGQYDGSLTLFNGENGEKIALLLAVRSHTSRITAMYWCKQYTDEGFQGDGVENVSHAFNSSHDEGTSVYGDRSNSLLVPYERTQVNKPLHCRETKTELRPFGSILMDMPLFGIESRMRNKLEILVSGDLNGVVTLNAFGYFSIGCIDLSGAFNKLDSQSSPKVQRVCMSSDLRMLVAILQHEEHCRFVSVDTSIVAEKANELRFVAAQCVHTSEHIAFAQKALTKMSKQWFDCLETLRAHLQPLVYQLKCFDRPNSPEQELFIMLTCGVASAALQSYISDLTEQGIQKLAKTLDSTCASLESIAEKVLLHSAQSLVFRLHDLLGHARWKKRFEQIGLDMKMVENSLKAAELFFLKVQELITWIRDARAGYAAFSVWIYSAWRKNQKPNVHEPFGLTGSEKNSPHIDVDRLTLLLSNSLLHDHITAQFKDIPNGLSACPSFSSSLADKASGIFLKDPSPLRPSSVSTILSSGTSAKLLSALRRPLFRVLNGLVSKWGKTFHSTADKLNEAFKPLDNYALPYTDSRRLDVLYSKGNFKVVIAEKRTLTLVELKCTRRVGKPILEKTMEIPTEEVEEIQDVRFYNTEHLLLTFKRGDQSLIGQLNVGEIGNMGTTNVLERQRALQPSSRKTVGLICVGSRGVGVVFFANRQFCLLDIEDDDEEED